MTPCLDQKGRCKGAGEGEAKRRMGDFGAFGGARLLCGAHDVNEAADVLVLKKLLGRKTRRAGVCSAAADKRTVGLMYITISRVPL